MSASDYNDLNLAGRKFTDPFLLSSNDAIPTDLDSALDLSFFLYHLNPQYIMASRRVVSHFVTDFEFTGDAGDDKERKELRQYLHDGIQMPGALLEAGEEYACFAGETKVTTREGVFEIRELAGKRVHVLSKGGVFRPADFKSFGVQPLLEVEFSDGQKVFATPEHQWEVTDTNRKARVVTTVQLRKDYRIKRTVAPRPAKDTDYFEGVRHGFVFGDGSRTKYRSRARFFDAKDEEMVQYFEGHGNERIFCKTRKGCSLITGLPVHFKKLPSKNATPSYWYGFVSGFLAADGHCYRRDGSVILTQADASVLAAIYDQLPRIGMAAGEPHSQVRDTEIRGRSYEDHEMHMLTLLKRFMRPEDFLISEHRQNFEREFDASSKYGEFIRIRTVRPTTRIEEVFCCTEMETHTIVVGNAILSKQCYGNGFMRIHFPFDRYLVDRRGHGAEYSLDMFGQNAKFSLARMTYTVPDPRHPGKEVELPFRDRRSTDLRRIKIRKLDPRRITIAHSFVSGRNRYVWRFEEWFTRDIREGRLHQVNETPICMLKAIKAGQDFLFHEDEIYHLHGPTITGVSNNGWGLPPPIANYRSLHNLQVYRRIDEAIGMDYMLPFRLLSPSASAETGGNMLDMLMSQWTGNARQLIANRRKDPYAIHAMPFPVTYQEFGAQGKQYVPKDLIEYQTNDMLDGMGYPAELFRGTLQVQQVPTAVRLFENSHRFLYDGFNGFTRWTLRRILDYLQREQITVTLQSPRIADNLEKQYVYMQLAAAGEISRVTAYRDLGITEPVEEKMRRLQEEAEIEKETMRIQAEVERASTAGSIDQQAQAQAEQGQAGSAAGGMPASTSPNPTTPLDIMEQAKEQATQLLQMPVGERRKALDQIRASNPTLHAAVKESMEQMRGSAASQGRAQVGQMAAQGGA